MKKLQDMQSDEKKLFLRQDQKNFKHKILSLPVWATSPSPLVCIVHLHYTLTSSPQKTQECLLAKRKPVSSWHQKVTP